MGHKNSNRRLLKNDLPQGSGLAPSLFNLYTADTPEGNSKNNAFADDLALTISCRTIVETENILTKDLSTL